MVQPKKKSARKLVRKHVQKLSNGGVAVTEVYEENPDYERVKAMNLPSNGDGVLDINGSDIGAKVQRLLKVQTFEPEFHYWLDTGSQEMNAVFGSPDKGIPYGKVIELGGPEHCGKTLIATVLMGMAQRDGAAAGYIDLENSRDEGWAERLGVRWSAVTVFYPKLMAKPKAKAKPGEYKKAEPKGKEELTAEQKARKNGGIPILQSSEDIFEEVEAAMELLAKAGAKKQIWFLDSIAMIVTAKQYAVGLGDSSMNSKLDRAMLLSTMLPRWAGLAANYNAMIFVSNQLRAKFGFVMGDPDDTTGGKALRHACAVRVRGRRLKGGRLKQGKAIVGLAGAFRNIKNKAGEGSTEGAECAFKIRWDKPKATVEFMSVKDLNEELGGNE